jgi:hypothetical protein
MKRRERGRRQGRSTYGQPIGYRTLTTIPPGGVEHGGGGSEGGDDRNAGRAGKESEVVLKIEALVVGRTEAATTRARKSQERMERPPSCHQPLQGSETQLSERHSPCEAGVPVPGSRQENDVWTATRYTTPWIDKTGEVLVDEDA